MARTWHRLQATVRRHAQDQTGSVLVAALVLTFVLTLLGFSLFDLALLDARLALGTEADFRALELANSAMERALYRLLLDMCGGSAPCASPPTGVSWADGDIDGTAFAVTTTNFATYIGSTTALSGSFGGQNYTGTYTIDLLNLTQTQANDLGLTCTADGPSSPCTDLIYVRATGNFRSGNVDSRTRTIQVIARGTFNGLGEGFVVGGPAADTINGNTDIHGSLHVVPCGSAPSCNQVQLSGSSGIRNNYNGMPSNLQNIVPLLQLVTCPAGTACAGSARETLNASLRVAFPLTAIDIGSNAVTIGESGSGNGNSYTGGTGKPTMDGVYISDGCQSSDCSDAVANRPGNVYSDTPIKAYDQVPAPTFPMLDDVATVFARNYDDYAACSGPGVCNASGVVVSGSGNDFFISHAFKIDSTTLEDSGGCLSTPPCTRNLHTILTGTGSGANAPWTDLTDTWRKTFSCVTTTCNDADGKRLNGSIVTMVSGVQTFPLEFQLEWRGNDWPTSSERNTFVVYQCPTSCAASKLVLTPTDPNTEVAFPVMIYVDGDLKICEGCNSTFFYVGNAAFLAKGTADDTIASNNPSIAVDPHLYACPPPCTGVDHNSFPKRHLLTFYTPGNANIGMNSNRDIMALFYAGGKWKTTKQTNLVGGITARVFDLTSQVPSLWQVSMPRTPVMFPPRGQRWSVDVRRWKECAGTVPSGPC